MQHYNLEVIEHRRWRVPVEAESEAEAITQIRREQKAGKAYLIDTRLEIACCNREEK
jgi:hypothetical protein